MSSLRRPVRLLVCGNVDRADDGAAPWATAALLDELSSAGMRHIDARRCGQLDIEHLLELPDDAQVVICDTTVGIRPGQVVTMAFDELLAHPHGPAPHSSHALPIDQVIGIARQLAARRVDGLFVGIGGEDFGFGTTLSAPVRAALPEFSAAIGAAISRLGAPAAVEV